MDARLGRRIPPHALGIGGSALAAAVTFGVLAVDRTGTAITLLLLGSAAAIAMFAPLAGLSLLLAATFLIPFDVQNEFGLGGEADGSGPLLIDVLLVAGLARVAFDRVTHRRMEIPEMVACVVLVVIVAQLGHGVVEGWSGGDAGAEARRVGMAAGGFLLAAGVLRDPAQSRLLPAVLLALGLAVAASGLLQWFLHADFNGSDFGVREGVAQTTAGRGQLQGGLFAYPMAVTFAFAALVSGQVRRGWPRALTLVALAANGMCLLFTHERTFWGAAVLGCALVLVRSAPDARRRAVMWFLPTFAALVVALLIAAPGEIRTAVERGASVSEVGSDVSVEYRIVEGRRTLEKIAASPLIGAGFGASISWEPPGFRERLVTTPYVHNGYLWLAWKMGLPIAAAIVAMFIWSFARRPPDGYTTLMTYLAIAAGASLLGLLLLNVTFPAFNALGIAVATGLLIALCWVPGNRYDSVGADPTFSFNRGSNVPSG
jgi:hypothetical protein